MKLSKTEKARRTTIAPKGFEERVNYCVMGDQFIKVLTFLTFPEVYGEGLLAQFMNKPYYHIDMVTEHSNIDVASAIKKEMVQLERDADKYSKQNDIHALERTRKKYQSYEHYVKTVVNNQTRTLNVVVNIYVRAGSLTELDERTREVTETFSSIGLNIRLKPLMRMQGDMLKKNSPLFMGSNLIKNMDYLIGQPLPSLSVAGLWPYIFNTLNDKYGTLIGRETTTGGKFIFDQFAYVNDAEAKESGRSAGNMVIVGRTGTGKSTLMNLLIMGHLTYKRKIIWCDPENKNEKLTRFVGGNFIEFGVNDAIINIFDLKPITTDSESIESEKVRYKTEDAISNVVEDLSITFKMLWEDITEAELDMINEITIRTYLSVGIDGTESFKNYTVEQYPTFTHFSAVIDSMLDTYEDLKEKKSIEYEALKRLDMKMRRLVGSNEFKGNWSRYFNGTTSIDTSALKDSGLVSIGTKSLFNVTDGLRNALLRLVFNYSWATCLGTNDETVFVTDEDHNYILVEEIASIKAQFQRRARKYNTVTLSGTQQVNEYKDPKILTHGKAIFDNATYKVFFNLSKDGVTDLSSLVSLTDQEKNVLQNLPPYTTLFEIGNQKMTVQVLATEEELSLM